MPTDIEVESKSSSVFAKFSAVVFAALPTEPSFSAAFLDESFNALLPLLTLSLDFFTSLRPFLVLSKFFFMSASAANKIANIAMPAFKPTLAAAKASLSSSDSPAIASNPA